MVFESIFQIWEIRLITRSETTVLKTGKTRLFCFLSDLLFLAIVFWTLSRFIPSRAWKNPSAVVILCLCSKTFILLPWSLPWTKIHLSPERFGYLKIWQCLQNKNILRNILASPGLMCEASTHAQAVVSQCRSQFYIKQKQSLPFCWTFWHGMKLKLALEIPLDILEIPLDVRSWSETPITNQVCKKSSTYQWLVLAFMVQLFAFCSVVWKSEAQ